MKMTRSREVLSTVMQIIITACTVCLIFSFVMNLTFASSGYYRSHFPSGMVADTCDAQLTEKFEALSDESGFPVRVFEMVKSDMPTVQAVNNAVERITTGESGDIYSQNLVDYFYNLCEDYASGNELAYDKSDLTATAEKAARLYSETVSIYGAESFDTKVGALRHTVTLTQFLSFGIILLLSFATAIMFTRKRLAYYKILGGVMGGAMGTLFTSLALYVIKPVMMLDITPGIYLSALSHMAGRYFITTSLISVALIVVSLMIMIQLERKYIKSKDKVKIV